MRRKAILSVVAIIVVAFGAFAVRLLWRAGAFRRIEPHFAGTCRLVKGPVGAEDIAIHPRSNVAYLSASDRRAKDAGRPVPGAIWSYDLNADAAAPVNLTPDAPLWFQPHGISLWAGENRDVLFVVNHPPAGTGHPRHTVEIFDVEADRLVHRATLTDPLLVMPNDLVAVGADRFYLTNTHSHRPGFLQTVETYLQFADARVLFYGPGGFRIALEDLLFPNGINVSPDGRTLYVASVTGLSVLVYDREPKTEKLAARGEIYLGSGPDNIDVDADGNLWIAAHPKLLRVGAHEKDPFELSPSQVLRVSTDGKVEEIYLDRGDHLSGSSVGAVSGKRLLIGPIFAEGFLDCSMAD